MHQYVNCIAHSSSEGQLLIGSEKTAIIDCGMAFCAEETIRKVQEALGDKPLDYILMTHTHYDHIGALPFFKKIWPNTCAVTSEAGAAVLLKDTPRRVIRELSVNAARTLGTGEPVDFSYNDDVFQANLIVKEGDKIPLGDITVEVLETPGHTRDSLCFFVPEIELLILNETPGVLMPDGSIYPCFLTSYSDTINAIEKCRLLPYKSLSLAHRGIVDKKDTEGFFEKALSVNIACHDFIHDMKKKKYSEDEMLDLFYQIYGTEILLKYQPKEAFLANARATIACALKQLE